LRFGCDGANDTGGGGAAAEDTGVADGAGVVAAAGTRAGFGRDLAPGVGAGRIIVADGVDVGVGLGLGSAVGVTCGIDAGAGVGRTITAGAGIGMVGAPVGGSVCAAAMLDSIPTPATLTTLV
jgi:hypothetical protein